MEDTGTTAPNWEGIQRAARKLALEFEAGTGKPANVLYLGWEEHLALCAWASHCTTYLCKRTGHLMWNGWRIIRVAEPKWLGVGHYE